MKEKIEKKLEEYAEGIIAKENPTMEDINFIVFLLNRIEMKENAELAKAEKTVRQIMERKNVKYA